MINLKTSTTSSAHQIRWVILLLAIAVILPTVCFLWFMVQAVENKSLALRQKMINTYQSRLKQLADSRLKDSRINQHLALESSDGFVVYDRNGKITFPVDDEYDLPDESNEFLPAFEHEYINLDLNSAVNEYNRIVETADSNDLAIKADISIMRCLRKLGRMDEVIERAENITRNYADSSKYIRSQKCHAYILLMDLTAKIDKSDYNRLLSRVYDYITMGLSQQETAFLGRKSHSKLYIPSSLQLLALDKFKKHAQMTGFDKINEKKYKRADWLSSRVQSSAIFASEYLRPDFINGKIKNSRIFRLKGNQQAYANYRIIKDYTYLMIFNKDNVSGWFTDVVEGIQDEMVFCRIFDEKGKFVAGTANVLPSETKIISEKNFLTFELDGYLSGWKAELYFYSGIFSDAARRQRIVYFFIGTLIVILIGAASTLATRAVLRQARLNTLKNDFIATVTHELKTPLASMRVLVDTLLEGNYKDHRQSEEYLQLISKENRRLTGLIDNFLTFSRMERNKQAFEILPCCPSEIACDAAEAMKTKFSDSNCKFEIKIAEKPGNVCADRDAMVTVLINLLDNAYKYSGNKKNILLEVFADKDQICFKVADNGIGIPKRISRRIFERFYQADSRLSRSAEGCGLGLSIVKFIIDAHGGSVDVQSKTGQGSTFNVYIPAD